MGNQLDFDVGDAGLRRDPFAYCRPFRERDPVHLSSHGYWVLTRPDHILEALRQPAAVTDRREAFRRRIGECPYQRHVDLNLFYRAGDDHARLRAPLARSFTAGAVRALSGVITERADEVLATVDGNGFDLFRDFTKRLPLMTIAALLGVPDESLDDLERWSYALVDALEPGAGPDVFDRANDASEGFEELLDQLLDERRASPRDDLLSRALEHGGATVDEIAHGAIFVLSAGHDTTAATISGAIELLMDRPDIWDRLRAEPELIEAAAEEAIRLVSPARIIGRQSTEAFELDGVDIDAGRPLLLAVAAANRDPDLFPSPDEFRLDRPNARRHLGFGFGPHVCLGAPLAREQVRIALHALVTNFERLEPTATPAVQESAIILSYRSQPVRAA